MNIYQVEVTDAFGGDANYSYVWRETITMPELTHYGYDGATNYVKASTAYRRQLVRKAKAVAGWTGGKCTVEDYGDMIRIEPRGVCMVAFVTLED